jgi:hypothetical protein
MTLVVDSTSYSFLPSVGSPFIYCPVPCYYPKPWRHVVVRFGSQVCYRGYLYAFDLYKELRTEVGLLIVRAVIGLEWPPITYFFIIKPWPCLQNKSFDGSFLEKNALP